MDKGVPAGSFQLVGFNSCDEALGGLRAAAKSVVGPYGFFSGGVWAAEGGARADGLAGAPVPAPAAQGAAGDSAKEAGGGGSTPNYSGTNTHEAGVEEPDLVKTDGRRIVTVSGGVLRVVDAASRSLAGFVNLSDPSVPDEAWRYAPADLLLAGDHALVLLRQDYPAYRGGAVEDVAVPPGAPVAAPGGAGATNPKVAPITGPRLFLVDISGQPRVLSTVRADGGLVDARQVGSTARVVIRSNPRLVFPYNEKATDAQRTNANKGIIERATIEQWLPRIEVTTGGTTQVTTIGCDAISRPAIYTGTSMLTVLTFGIGASALGDGQPTSLVADGDTVYSNGPSLYVASDQRWRAVPMVDGRAEAKPADARTEIYKFDSSSAGRPTFVAGGSVPGYLINQYAMSEWDGKLRVAATAEPSWNAQGQQQRRSQSGIYVLSPSGRSLKQIGKVEGLGKGERIFAVRFAGPIGYVVTFRQTDPLYTVDLGDPTKPTVRGELKIPGYSAYLHPAGTGRLLGIGQDATDRGQVTGLQVSLFDVGDLEKPGRISQYKLSGGNSEAEFDPHAFLYWPSDGLLVVPLQRYDAVPVPGGSGPGFIEKTAPSVGALVLRVSGDNIFEVGFIRHPAAENNPGYPAPIRRSLIIGETLWTVSDGGLMATDTRSMVNLAWIAFD